LKDYNNKQAIIKIAHTFWHKRSSISTTCCFKTLHRSH